MTILTEHAAKAGSGSLESPGYIYAVGPLTIPPLPSEILLPILEPTGIKHIIPGNTLNGILEGLFG